MSTNYNAYCPRINTCKFYKLHADTTDSHLKDQIRDFCLGKLFTQCERKHFYEDHAYPAPLNLSPSGMMLKMEYPNMYF